MSIGLFTGIQLLQGSLTLTFIIITLIVGIRILFKYSSSGKIEHVTMGLAWIFLSSAWWGSTTKFLLTMVGLRVNNFYLLLLSNAFLPIAIITWLYSITHILNKEYEKQVTFSILIACLIYETYLIISLFINPNLIGRVEGINSIPTLIPAIFEITVLALGVVSGAYFSIKSMRVEDSRVKWRGRFLLIAFISLAIGGLLDATIGKRTELLLILVRLILISSSIEYYLAFFTSERILKLLVKE